jgi:lysophospholipase L1-like esterase
MTRVPNTALGWSRLTLVGELPGAARMMRSLLQILMVTGVVVHSAVAGQSSFKFDFTGGEPMAGFTPVSPTNLYSDKSGFGFEPGSQVVAGGHCLGSDRPFLFSVRLPEGNYSVTVTFGDDASPSENTVKAELRRLMVEQARTPRGGSCRRTFIVNVRTPSIGGGTEVRLKAREKENEVLNWDDRLTLEFNGTHPCVRLLEVERAEVPVVFLLGDSTVCDQPHEPWNSWGQMLPRFFGPDIAVANHAESGESIKSSLGARRFDKVFSQMKAGDWLLLQFGHNDMKDKATNALATYKSNLKRLVVRTREHGGTPVLVTSMERKAGIEHDTLDGYPNAVREVAKEDSVALIDLHAMSKVLYRALGANLDRAFQDGTHHNNYGSYELARCVVEGIRAQVPGLAKHLADDAGKFDPAKPDAPDDFKMAVSLEVETKKPDGN